MRTICRLALFLAILLILAGGLAYVFSAQEADVSKGAPSANPSEAPDQKADSIPTITISSKQRGVSWVGGRPVSADNFDSLVANHVNWIVQTPFGWQSSLDSPAIRLATDGNVYWGETDEGLRITAELARAKGIHTLLKPHVWIMRGGGWRGEIEMKSNEDWDEWFNQYQQFILHYAKFAQDNNIEALCVGTELHNTLRNHEKQWRNIIAQIRKVYHGSLTYAANWYKEYEEVLFWDALDDIGIQAYFPLTDSESNTSIEDLRSGWDLHLRAIEKIHTKFKKPVIFTEIGYRSTPKAAREPWIWPVRGRKDEVDLQLQKRCYQAFFETAWQKPWMQGVYFWKWFPHHSRAGRASSDGFTPQNKPAEIVMRKWFSVAAQAATSPPQSSHDK